MHFCFSCILYLSFGTEIACYNLTNNNALDQFLGYIVFAGRGHQKIKEVMMLIKITGESVKFIRSIFLINISLQLYISYLNKHSHFITFHFVY